MAGAEVDAGVAAVRLGVEEVGDRVAVERFLERAGGLIARARAVGRAAQPVRQWVLRHARWSADRVGAREEVSGRALARATPQPVCDHLARAAQVGVEVAVGGRLGVVGPDRDLIAPQVRIHQRRPLLVEELGIRQQQGPWRDVEGVAGRGDHVIAHVEIRLDAVVVGGARRGRGPHLDLDVQVRRDGRGLVDVPPVPDHRPLTVRPHDPVHVVDEVHEHVSGRCNPCACAYCTSSGQRPEPEPPPQR